MELIYLLSNVFLEIVWKVERESSHFGNGCQKKNSGFMPSFNPCKNSLCLFKQFENVYITSHGFDILGTLNGDDMQRVVVKCYRYVRFTKMEKIVEFSDLEAERMLSCYCHFFQVE